MSVLADYTPEEQQTLLQSLRAAAVAVSAASPGRERETASEGIAAATYIIESRGEFLDNPLIGSVLFELEQRAASESRFANFVEIATAPGAHAQAMETLRDAVALLAERVEPAEAAGYRRWLYNIADRTAHGGQEGGNFLGWGSVAVNEAEEAALKEIAQLLGLAA